MSIKSKIVWTDATWNPVTGCSKLSAGCKHCYAEREWPRMTRLVSAYAGRDFGDVRCHEDRLGQPLRWKKPRRIFVNSMSDLFHPAVPDEFIDRVFAVMSMCPQHIFQVLTKRPERMLKHPIFSHSGTCLWVGVRQEAERMFSKEPGPISKALPNVWLGVSIEDQKTADVRIPPLLDTPAAVRWISAEPLLGPVRLDEHGLHGGPGQLDWVVVGGESGPEARPMHPAWPRSLRDHCASAGVPFLFKQWGEWAPRSACYHTFEGGKSFVDIDPSATRWPCIRMTERGHSGRDLAHAGEGDHAYMQRVGKRLAGRLLDGVEHNGFPIEA